MEFDAEGTEIPEQADTDILRSYSKEEEDHINSPSWYAKFGEYEPRIVFRESGMHRFGPIMFAMKYLVRSHDKPVPGEKSLKDREALHLNEARFWIKEAIATYHDADLLPVRSNEEEYYCTVKMGDIIECYGKGRASMYGHITTLLFVAIGRAEKQAMCQVLIRALNDLTDDMEKAGLPVQYGKDEFFHPRRTRKS